MLCKSKEINVEIKVAQSLPSISMLKVVLNFSEKLQSGHYKQGQITQCSPSQFKKLTVAQYA